MLTICEVLKQIKTIAVLGISDKPNRDSGSIALFLRNRGFSVCGVHPNVKAVEDILVYKTISEIPHAVDCIDVFMNGDRLPDLLPQIIEKKPAYVWFQLGVKNDSAAVELEKNGITVIQDKCIAVEYRNCRES